jgi:hypothetical protein
MVIRKAFGPQSAQSIMNKQSFLTHVPPTCFDLYMIIVREAYTKVQGDQKVSVHLMITVQKTRPKFFKQFQSLTMKT